MIAGKYTSKDQIMDSLLQTLLVLHLRYCELTNELAALDDPIEFQKEKMKELEILSDEISCVLLDIECIIYKDEIARQTEGLYRRMGVN